MSFAGIALADGQKFCWNKFLALKNTQTLSTSIATTKLVVILQDILKYVSIIPVLILWKQNFN